MSMTCASWNHRFNTHIAVRYDGKIAIVRVNDRGPAKSLKRDLDLSLAAFRSLCDPDAGLIKAQMMEIR